MEEPRLETRIRKPAEDVYIVDVKGQIDIATTPAFKEILGEAADGSNGHVIVNMADVAYMDSSGFGTLLGATKRLRPAGGAIHLVGCNEVIERMLRITRLNTILSLHASEDEALQAIRPAAGDANGATPPRASVAVPAR
jgi:anti-anti-sigma factor